MWDRIGRESLEGLIRHHGDPSVSIYMPTHRCGPQTQQGRIRLKNLLRDAEAQLAERIGRAADARRLLGPAARLVRDEPFWQHQERGLALFIDEAETRYHRLPIETEELVLVAERFHVLPLIPLAVEDSRFYVLAISENRVRLFEGDRYAIREAEAPGLPRSFEEVRRFIDSEKQLQWHTGAPGQQAMFHGHGAGPDEKKAKKWLADFCHLVDRKLGRVLGDDSIPLVLAATEPLAGLYREFSGYGRLLERTAAGNPDHLTDTELHALAWPAVEDLLERNLRRAAERYERAGRERGADRLDRVLPAACRGRIELLLVGRPPRHQWGRFDPESGAVETHEQRRNGDEDLLNLAAVQTLRTGGQVQVVPQEKMPGPQPLAAVLRY